MSLARNISFFVNSDQGHERKNLKDRENSVFTISNVIKVEIVQKPVWFYLKNPVRYLNPPPRFCLFKKKLPKFLNFLLKLSIN